MNKNKHLKKFWNHISWSAEQIFKELPPGFIKILTLGFELHTLFCQILSCIITFLLNILYKNEQIFSRDRYCLLSFVLSIQ